MNKPNGHRTLLVLVALYLPAACAAKAPPQVVAEGGRYAEVIEFPVPASDGDVSVETALMERRSLRVFDERRLTNGELAQLLWAGQGVTSTQGHRTAPSAGALYPLELYAVTPDRLYRYLPEGHRAEVRPSEDLRRDLSRAAFDQESLLTAPVILVVAGVPRRSAVKYGEQAAEFVLLEAGHATQNVLLQAVAMGMGGVPVGGVDPAEVGRILALPPDEEVMYLVPVGYVATDPP